MQPYPIDIIIPWVNPNDSKWQKDFTYWKHKETGVKDACRFNDWGLLRFVLRSIDENCPWCHKVFLVIRDKDQIPNWLNASYSGIEIVFHNEYIPCNMLPTFNSNVIEMYFPYIKQLSNNFISCNDDMFFCTKQSIDFFFDNGLPVCKPELHTVGKVTCNWEHILHNNVIFTNTLFNNATANSYYFPLHLPVAYSKQLQLFVHSKMGATISKCLHGKFRTDDDINHWVFYDVQCKLHQVRFNNSLRGRSYGNTDKIHKIDFNQPMICLNEGEYTTDEMMQYYVSQLWHKFPNKSRFER